MKNGKTLAGVTACIAAMLSTMPLGTAAEEETLIYGKMNIPYAEFYRAEIAGSANAYEVDAVSSATTAKWCKNGKGDLFEGTYNQANEDGTGMILGVTYPVALTQETLDALGENTYGFQALDTVPAAYKTVTVTDGMVSFSAVQDADPVVVNDAVINISTKTAWGDYLLTVEGMPEDMGVIYGWVLHTESGERYAMRHLENIWRGQLAWSTGFVTSEPHGNTLTFENFAGIMGETITEMSVITENGYYTVPTSNYVPVKFDGSAEVASADVASGSTSVTVSGFPTDYVMTYAVDGLNASVADGTLTYSDAVPGAYTLTISDANGVYADVPVSFTLTTDAMPAAFDGTDKIVKADGATDEDFNNFMANIAAASVNGKEYSISGRRGVKIFTEDGTIDFSASTGGANVFDGSGNYTMTVTATGYTKPLEFTITKAEEPTEAAATTATNTGNTAATTPVSNASKTTTAKAASSAKTTTAASKSSTQTSTTSPGTGAEGIAIPAVLLTIAGAAAVISKKRK